MHVPPPDKQDAELARLAFQSLRKPDSHAKVVRLQVEGLGSAVVVPEIAYHFLLVILEYMANGEGVILVPHKAAQESSERGSP